MSQAFTESVVEQAALAWLESLCWQVKHGLEIACLAGRQAAGESKAERIIGRVC